MNRRTLARVYLDNEPVALMADPKPQLAKILAAAGRAGDAVHVLRLRSPHDADGRRLRLGGVLDRTEAAHVPIYLRSVSESGRPLPARPSHSSTTPTCEEAVPEWPVGRIATPRPRPASMGKERVAEVPFADAPEDPVVRLPEAIALRARVSRSRPLRFAPDDASDGSVEDWADDAAEDPMDLNEPFEEWGFEGEDPEAMT